MFRPVRILNAGTNVPEIFRLPVMADTVFHAGDALILSSGRLTHATETVKPTYVAAADAPENASTLAVYAVTPDVIFETPISASPASLTIGKAVTLSVESGTSAATGVTATTTNGVATIVDLCQAAAVGDIVRVKFQ